VDLKPNPALGFKKPSEFDVRVLALFERALVEREDLKKWIEELSLKSDPTVRDRLCLVLYRHQLAFREPQLPAGVALTAMSLWRYWMDHPAECSKHQSLESEIRSYLWPSEELEADKVNRKLVMLDVINTDTLTYLALYPIIEEMLGKQPGRPATRRGPIAVSALQMKLDNNLTWLGIAKQVCDCLKGMHDHYCAETIRLSTVALEKLLRQCGIELPEHCS
jgi:hypothetical protein